MMAFAWPWLLLALPLPWLLAWWLPARAYSGTRLRLPHPGLQALWQSDTPSRRGIRPRWWAVLIWALLCLAAARPQSLGEAVQPPRSGRNLMLVVDLSGSMGQADMRLGGRVVDRLTAVKAVVGDFLQRRVGDRVGLVVFGDRAYAITPLTFDRHAVGEQLADTVVALAGRETAIGDAIAIAVKRLRQQQEVESATGEQVIILLTDGVSNAGSLSPVRAAALAAAASIRIHTIAFGGDGGDGIFGIFRAPANAGIDEAGLRSIAEQTGGSYFRARDTAELAEIYAQLDRIEPAAQAGAMERPRSEHYPFPLAAAVLLMLVAVLWPRRGYRS
ncbi:MAG: hypothetical protein COW59_05490 [Lysobacterales bacterium CG17_big_fil_post_rev_8_21_14_2_50_64_11]|nr:MAG: hypothetical protein COW59_05490 [Xanthomonadales bacterium CG17_big_fil_post_rev_8_21_14_2_50_64_11]